MENKEQLSLAEIGWQPFFEIAFDDLKRADLIPARIALAEINQYRVVGEFGEIANMEVLRHD